MLTNWKIKMLSFLCVLALFSVGFSSWSITGKTPDPYATTGGVQTDYVIKTDDYVSFKEVVLPAYNAGGFIEETTNTSGTTIYKNSATATMILRLAINSQNCSVLKNNGETTMDITCSITLKTNAYTFFNDALTSTGFQVDVTGANKDDLSCEKIMDETVTPNRCIGYIITLKNYNFESLTEDGEIELTITLTAGSKTKVACLENNEFQFNTKVYTY